MAFDFPNSPTNGQIYSPPGGPSYIWDGTVWKVTGTPSAPYTGFLQQQIKTTSGAITLHPETKAFLVEVQGGGGGGGTASSSGANFGTPTGGAGAGGYCSKWIVRPTSGTFAPACTVGANSGSPAVNGNGSQYVDGNNTLTAGGGAQGGGTGGSGSNNWSYDGGAGGSASGGDVNVSGEQGDSGFAVVLTAGASANVVSGKGGSCRFGSGGKGGRVTIAAAGGAVGGGGAGYGSGGGGGCAAYAGGGYSGGIGAAGVVVITEYR